jgi:hypothetical protein
MISTNKSHIPKKVSPFGSRGFFLNIPVIQRFHNLNLKAVNMFSTILISLFADYYPTLKH